MDERGFDYIVISAGSSACGMENRLSADSEKRVLLLEASGLGARCWVARARSTVYFISVVKLKTLTMAADRPAGGTHKF